MRVRLDRNANPISSRIAYLLEQRKFTISPFFSNYTVFAEVDPRSTTVVVDGVDSLFERNVVNWIAKLFEQSGIEMHISLKRQGGVQDSKAIRVIVPDDDQVQGCVEHGIVAGLELTARAR